MKHEIICNDFQYGGLKNVDTKSKIIILQYFWIKKLYDESFQEWKTIPIIKNTFGECFFFQSSLDFNVSLKSFPQFYINVFHSWENTFAFLSLAASCLRSQYLWFNKDIKINKKPFHSQDFSKEKVNFVEHLCKPSGFFKSWREIKTEYNPEEKMFYKWCQLLHAILNQWMRIIKTTNISCTNIVYHDHHLVKNDRIVTLENEHLHHNNILKLCFPHLNLN